MDTNKIGHESALHAAARVTNLSANKHIEPCMVFLVDDDPDDQFLEKRELETSPYVKSVTCFAAGEELIAYMEKHGFMDRSVLNLTPLLIVIDLDMPGLNGFKILKELKSDSFLKPIPVVVVSGTQSPQDIERAWILGASGVFRKPLNVSRLDEYFEDAWVWPPKDLWAR